MKHIRFQTLTFCILLASCLAKPTRPDFGNKGAADADEEPVRHGPVDSDEESSDASTSEETPSSGESQLPTSSAPTSATVPASPAPAPQLPIPVVSAPNKSAAEIQIEKNLALLASKQVRTNYTVTDATGWGTNASKRLEILVAVDANGKALVPKNVSTQQIRTNMDDSKDSSFKMSGDASLNELHSFVKICNKSAKSIELHAQGSVPFDHGNESIAPNSCAKFLVNKFDNIKDGDSYDHLAGGQDSKNFIYMKLIKIKPDGTTVADDAVANAPSTSGAINYDSVKKVFADNCVGCHGTKGNVTLSSYQNIKNSLAKVQSAIEQKKMPPTGLAAADKKLLEDWFAKGAPEK